MAQMLKNLLSDEIIDETYALPNGLDEEGEYEVGYRPTGHPGVRVLTPSCLVLCSFIRCSYGMLQVHSIILVYSQSIW